jgi:DnaJ-class molecular chaperone
VAPLKHPSEPDTKESVTRMADAPPTVICPTCDGNGGFRSLAWDGELSCMRCWGTGRIPVQP